MEIKEGKQMSITMIVLIIGFFFGGGYIGYQYADRMPDDYYGSACG